jgi:holo-[acyl-carrier protein] synthase
VGRGKPLARFLLPPYHLERIWLLDYDTQGRLSMHTSGQIGLGVDLVSIPRIERILDRWGGKFLKRVYTEGEVEYCGAREGRARSLAARFAAKEAFFKAVAGHQDSGDPGSPAIRHRDIEVVVAGNGAPSLRLHRGAKAALGSSRAALSLSHEQDMAIAVVVTFPEVTG